MANPTLLDIAKLNADDAIVPLIEKSLSAHPETTAIGWDTIPGQAYKTLLRTAVPSVGFREGNKGVATVKSAWENRIVETFILDASVEVDKAVADRYKDGRDAYMAKEAAGLIEGAMRAVASQCWYGRATTVATSAALQPTKGFPGLIECYDSTNMDYDAGGTSATTGSSAWLIATGMDKVHWVLGEDGAIDVGEIREVRLTDGTNPYDGYRMPILAYVGLQLVNPNCMVRVRDLTADSGKTLTDAILYLAMDKFPVGMEPTDIFMTRRSRAQLRGSRTATNAIGAPAPNPTEFDGVPIHVTDGIVNTEVLNYPS